jgi:hypothetical protein
MRVARCSTAMTIEVLTVEDCPHVDAALSRVRAILDETGIAANVAHVVVRDGEAARRLRFPGSPTIRIDGLDVEPVADGYGLACRVYRDGDSISGVPPVQLIEAAVLRHAR